MIISASTGQGFRGAISYVEKEHERNLTPEQKPEILHENNIAGTAQDKAQQMRFVANGNSRASRPVLHISVSFHKDEKITPQQRDKVLNDVVKEIGATKENNQYQIVKHNDAGHEHYHIVLNKVGFDGKNINTSYIKNKCQVIADKLEQKHDLRRTAGRTIVYDPSNEKGYRYTTKAERSQELKKPQDREQGVKDKKAYVQQEVGRALQDSKSLAELKTSLASKGIETSFTQNKNGLSGVSFRYQKQAVKGSAIGFKASEVKKSIEQNSGQKLEPYQEVKAKPIFEQSEERNKERERVRQIEKLDRSIDLHEKFKTQLEDLKQHAYNVIEQTKEQAYNGEKVVLKDSVKSYVVVDEQGKIFLQHKDNHNLKTEVSELKYIAKVEESRGERDREYNRELDRYVKIRDAEFKEVPSSLNVFKREERKQALEYNARLKAQKDTNQMPAKRVYREQEYKIFTPDKLEGAKQKTQQKIDEMTKEKINAMHQGKGQEQEQNQAPKQAQENAMERAERLRKEREQEQEQKPKRSRGRGM